MSKEFPSRHNPRISMFHPTASAPPQRGKDSDKGSNNNPSNIVFERTERVLYDYEKPTPTRFGTTKGHRVTAEAPYEHGHHHHNHNNQYHRFHHTTNIKSERPYYSIHPTPTDQLPEFHTDFGPFGKTVRRSLDNETDDPYFTGHDISDLYNRPHDQKLKYPYTKCYITPDGQQDCREIVVDNTKPVDTKHSNANEGHAILSKYISRGHEDKNFQDNYKERDPDFFLGNKPHASTEVKVCENNICVTQQPDKHKEPEHKGPPPVCKDNIDGECKKKTKHVFPFKETPDGHLLIDPKLVAFENHKLSVLVANPNKTKLNININNNDAGEIHAITDPGRDKSTSTKVPNDADSSTPIVDQDTEEVRNFLLKINQNAKKDFPASDDLGSNRLVETHSLDNQYSSASRGTESYMENLHNRVKKAIHPDTYVVIGQKFFPCHSVALQVCSSFFENIKRPRPTIHNIELPEKMVSALIFPSIMEWMLETEEGRKSIIGKDNVIAIYIAAVYLDMQELQDQCLEFIQTSMNPGDPLLMLMWDEVKTKPRCQEMMVALASKAASLFPELYKSKKFLRLEIDELKMLLSSDEVVITNELQIFDAAIRWLLFDWFNRKVYIPTIMGTVRFGLMTPLNLTQVNHCPDSFRERSAKEYSQILSHPEVKALMDAGLAFSILQESYDDRPEELKKWLETTKIAIPRPRVNTGKTKIKPSSSVHSVGKAKDGKAKSVMSQGQVRYTPTGDNLKPKEETKLQDSTSSKTDNWEKVRSKVTPATSQEKIQHKAAQNFASKDRMAGTFISSDTAPKLETPTAPALTNAEQIESDDSSSSGSDSDDQGPNANQEPASKPIKNEKQLIDGTRNSNPRVPLNSTGMARSNSNQSHPTAPYPDSNQPVIAVPNPSQPNASQTKTPSPHQSNPKMPNTSASNPYPGLSVMNENQNANLNATVPTPNPNQPMVLNPNKSQTKVSQSSSKTFDPNVKKSQSGKQTPNKKSKSKSRSKLMQPKYFSKSKNPGDKNADNSGTDTT